MPIALPLPAPPPCDTVLPAPAHVVVAAGVGTVQVAGDRTRRDACLVVRGAGARWRVAGDSLVLTLPGGTGRGAPTVTVRVPLGVAVRGAVAGASLAVEGTQGVVSLRAPAGRVTVRDVRELVVEGAAARIEATRVAGGVRLRTATGPVALDDVGGDVTVEGGSGEVTVRRAHGATFVARTTSGRVRWQGAPDPAGRYEIRTATGPVDLAFAPGVAVAGTVEQSRPALSLGAGLAESSRGVERGRTVVAWTSDPAPAPGGTRVVVRTVTAPVRLLRAAELPPPGRLR
jgi:hypothetical protein